MDESHPLYEQDIQSILLWMPNWIGDVILARPSLQSLRRAYPKARITVVAKPPSDELLLGHPAINTVLPLPSGPEAGFWKHINFARSLKKYQFDVGIVFPNSFGAAFLLTVTGAKSRLGYNTDGRDIFLTHPIVTTNNLKKNGRCHRIGEGDGSPRPVHPPVRRIPQHVRLFPIILLNSLLNYY